MKFHVHTDKIWNKIEIIRGNNIHWNVVCTHLNVLITFWMVWYCRGDIATCINHTLYFYLCAIVDVPFMKCSQYWYVTLIKVHTYCNHSLRKVYGMLILYEDGWLGYHVILTGNIPFILFTSPYYHFNTWRLKTHSILNGISKVTNITGKCLLINKVLPHKILKFQNPEQFA